MDRFKSGAGCFCPLISLFMLCLTYPVLASVADYIIEQIPAEHGLSQNSVADFAQDAQGYLWLATQEGLNRYDGYQFKVFKHNPKDQTSLSHNNVLTLLVDSQDRLWVLTLNGINRFVPESQSFQRYLTSKAVGDLYNNVFTKIVEGRQQQIWVGGRNGVYRFDPERDSFIHYPHNVPDTVEYSLHRQNIFSLYIDNKDEVWAGSVNGVYRLDKTNERFEPYFTPYPNQENHVHAIVDGLDDTLWIAGDARFGLYRLDRRCHGTMRQCSTHYLPEVSVINLFRDKQNRLWILTQDGLYLYQANADRFSWYLAAAEFETNRSSNRVSDILVSHDGAVWFVSNIGVHLFEPEHRQFKHFVQTSDGLASLSGHKLFIDKYNNVWIASTLNGVSKIIRQRQKFVHLAFADSKNVNIDNDIVRTVYEDPALSGKVLWLGLNNAGLKRIEFDGKGWRKENIVTIEHFLRENDAFNLTGNMVNAVFRDSRGILWVGSDGGLQYLDEHTGRLVSFDIERPMEEDIHVKMIIEDSKNHLWIASYEGVMQLRGNNISRYRQSWLHPQQAPDGQHANANESYTLFEDSQGHIWFGARRGLYRFNPGDSTLSAFLTEKDNSNSISHNWVHAITELPAGTFWIGTRGGGLNRLRFDGLGKPQWRHFNQTHGLANDYIYAILRDEQAGLWLSSNNGIMRFDTQSNEVRSYSLDDGLQGLEFSHGVASKGDSGNYYFGGINGINLFHPQRVGDNPIAPDTVLQQLSVNERSFHFSAKIPHRWPYYDNNFVFEYAGLQFSHPQNNRYRYRLLGASEFWIDAGDQRTARYPKLPPGDYIFQVKSANSDGVWNNKVVEYRFSIDKPYWLTGWAFAGYFVVLASVAYGVVRWRTNLWLAHRHQLVEQYRRQRRRADTAMKSQRMLFENVSHEFRTPLTVIVSSVGLLKPHLRGETQLKRIDGITANCERMLYLVDELLSLAALENQPRHEKHTVDVAQVIEEAVNTLNADFDCRGQTLDCRISHSCQIKMTENALQQILFNLLSNAGKYSPNNSIIKISVKIVQGWVTIRVSDQGPGVPEQLKNAVFDRFYRMADHYRQQGTGLGLYIVKQLVERNGGNIEIESNNGIGACFIVTLPCIDDSLREIECAPVAKTTSKLALKPAETEQSAQTGLPRKCLLLVEDDPDIMAILCALFEELYQLLSATDGMAGLALARQHSPDLIISDVMMPKMDGLELCQQLSQVHETRHIPVLLLTARGDHASRLRGLNMSAVDYISKPFDNQELQIKVHNLIGKFESYGQYIESHFFVRELDQQKVKPKDRAFLEGLDQFLLENFSNDKLSVNDMAAHMNMEQSTLRKKCKQFFDDKSPVDVITTFRLERAKGYLQRGESIGNTAGFVGFADAGYFGKAFKKRFNQTPTQFVKSLADEHL